MIVKAAYIGIILIWSTTPLAIQWSSNNDGYLFAVTARMAIGLFVLMMLFAVIRIKLPINRQAIHVYILSGVSIFISMLLVYWGAQYIPSGWIAIVFGLSPIITGIFSTVLFKENIFNSLRLVGLISAVVGLMAVFIDSTHVDKYAAWGIIAVLISTISHALGALLIKKINTSLSGMQSTYGGLLVAVPLFAIVMIIQSPAELELTLSHWIAIIYLGVIATALGFSLYYFVLKNMPAIKVSMITLITPVTALALGTYFNNEVLTVSVVVGASLVLLGLALFEFEESINKIFKRIHNSNTTETG